MTEAIVVGVLVGAFSGLLGSIAGPHLAHRLARKRRKEERREDRHRELRAMLEERMHWANKHQSFYFRISTAESLGKTGLEVMQTTLEEWLKDEKQTVWRPHRIDDKHLQEIAVELNDLTNEMFAKLIEASVAGVDSTTTHLDQLTERLSTLVEQVDKRLDELDW